MASILLTGPAVEPVTLAEIKAYLRVEHGDDDAVIATLIAGARAHVEAQTRRALIAQTRRLVRDAWPADGRIAVTPAPLREVLAARVYDAEGVAHTLDAEAFVVDAAASVLAVAPWPAAPGRRAAGIEIDVAVGYGEAPADVPEPLRQAVRLVTAHWYENRGLIAAGQSVALLPGATIAALLAPFRVVSL